MESTSGNVKTRVFNKLTNKVDSNDFQAFLCEMQVKFQFLVLQIVCGGGGNFKKKYFEIIFAIFYDILLKSTGFWHSRYRRPLVGILGNSCYKPNGATGCNTRGGASA